MLRKSDGIHAFIFRYQVKNLRNTKMFDVSHRRV